jgi:hypothetical protein
MGDKMKTDRFLIACRSTPISSRWTADNTRHRIWPRVCTRAYIWVYLTPRVYELIYTLRFTPLLHQLLLRHSQAYMMNGVPSPTTIHSPRHLLVNDSLDALSRIESSPLSWARALDNLPQSLLIGIITFTIVCLLNSGSLPEKDFIY